MEHHNNPQASSIPLRAVEVSIMALSSTEEASLPAPS